MQVVQGNEHVFFLHPLKASRDKVREARLGKGSPAQDTRQMNRSPEVGASRLATKREALRSWCELGQALSSPAGDPSCRHDSHDRNHTD